MTTRIVMSWSCLGTGHQPCDAHGTGPRSDLEARKHTEATKHGTITTGTPATTTAPGEHA